MSSRTQNIVVHAGSEIEAFRNNDKLFQILISFCRWSLMAVWRVSCSLVEKYRISRRVSMSGDRSRASSRSRSRSLSSRSRSGSRTYSDSYTDYSDEFFSDQESAKNSRTNGLKKPIYGKYSSFIIAEHAHAKGEKCWEGKGAVDSRFSVCVLFFFLETEIVFSCNFLAWRDQGLNKPRKYHVFNDYNAKYYKKVPDDIGKSQCLWHE